MTDAVGGAVAPSATQHFRSTSRRGPRRHGTSQASWKRHSAMPSPSSHGPTGSDRGRSWPNTSSPFHSLAQWSRSTTRRWRSADGSWPTAQETSAAARR